MPWYRVNGMLMHMRGSKLPEPCVAKIWLDGKEVLCLGMSGYLCDHPDGGGRTCDRALCDVHAHQVGKNRHFCPEHQVDAAQPSLFSGLLTQESRT